MKILFSGLPYFGKKLVHELSELDQVNRYVFCDTYYSRKDQVRFLWHLLTAKKVVSFNGASSASGSLDWVLRFKKKLIMQWHGSDVLTLRKNKLGRYNNYARYIEQADSYTDAVWLKEELHELGVNARIIQFKYVTPTSETQSFQTADVVSYVAQNNEAFYGIAQIEKLAVAFPQTVFHIVGSDGKNQVQHPNIKYHGWVEKTQLKNLMNANAVYLRLTAHDGYSLSILEALANGNYVIWNNPHPCVHFVENDTQLNTVFKEVLERVQRSGFQRLMNNINWIRQHHHKETVLRNYIQMLTHD